MTGKNHPAMIEGTATSLPSADLSLPSPHIEHAVTFESEMQNRLHGFQSGIVALQGELDGQQQAFDKDAAERQAEFDRAASERLARHAVARSDLERRIGDLQVGADMAKAALAAKVRQ